MKMKTPKRITAVTMKELHRAGGCLDKGKYRYQIKTRSFFDFDRNKRLRFEYVVRIKRTCLDTPAVLDKDYWELVEVPYDLFSR